ncbi:hypothetical protein ABEB22_18390 (plasmid) [Thioclava sp. 'Guangxiensis']|uniref:hypothetical protein n=1 Tax=Thioclava sp. 'Guangxiensis' TaxID=3149044 RepID=UPI00387803A7
MRPAMFLSLMLLVTACARSAEVPTSPRPSAEGLCAGLEGLARSHARALAESTDDDAVVTGDMLISGLIAACGYEAAP